MRNSYWGCSNHPKQPRDGGCFWEYGRCDGSFFEALESAGSSTRLHPLPTPVPYQPEASSNGLKCAVHSGYEEKYLQEANLVSSARPCRDASLADDNCVTYAYDIQ